MSFWIEVHTNKRSYCIRGGHGSYRVMWLPGEKVISMTVINDDGMESEND